MPKPLLTACITAVLVGACAAALPEGATHTNSIGMRFIRIEPGEFLMGCDEKMPAALIKNLSYPKLADLNERYPCGDPNGFVLCLRHVVRGDFDEKPVHNVKITRPFYMAATEVTNARYELFDPAHRLLRGKNGFSREDDEAVVFVSWYEAASFCRWLSEKENISYRLPTEAEWEYACRAGTKTLFNTGDELPERYWKNQQRTTFSHRSDIVSLSAGKTPPNRWGLHDMHGNVEEWTNDWYGPYAGGSRIDPRGCASGDFKVTRGGSHGTNVYYLRSANRLGTLPENRTWLIGFRPVIAEEPLPGEPSHSAARPLRRQVSTRPAAPEVDANLPYFTGPLRYVRIARGAAGPLYHWHNHDPAVVSCPNGDVLAIWYTCVEERGRELGVAASRLQAGAAEWQTASPFWDAPDRNDHCPALWNDGNGTIYHFNGLSVAGMWHPLAVVMRKSRDSGRTWSRGRFIVPEHGRRNNVGEPVLRTRDGAILLGVDVSDERHWGSGLWISRNEGLTWRDPGGNIRGIHAAVAELTDGRLYALGRGMAINGRMTASCSSDGGQTWTHSASPFSPITGGQRAAMLRLREGPLLLASFANDPWHQRAVPEGTGSVRHIANVFAALSFDDGLTWPVRKTVTPGGSDRPARTIDGGRILMNDFHCEPLGYLSICQAQDGLIHLISSRNHYAFNLAWLNSISAGDMTEPLKTKPPLGECGKDLYEGSTPPDKHTPAWNRLGEPVSGIIRNDQNAFLELSAPRASSVSFSSERMAGFGEFDAEKGIAVEIAAAIKEDRGRCGLELELFLRTGPLTVNHYRLGISRKSAYYWYDNRYESLAAEIDNASSIHTWRLHVRPDTAVQVYRDGELLAVRPADLVISWYEPPRGSYIKWSVAPGARVLIDRIGKSPG